MNGQSCLNGVLKRTRNRAEQFTRNSRNYDIRVSPAISVSTRSDLALQPLSKIPAREAPLGGDLNRAKMQ